MVHLSRKPKLGSLVTKNVAVRKTRASNDAHIARPDTNHPVFGSSSYVQRVIRNYALDYIRTPRRLLSVPRYFFQFMRDVAKYEQTLGRFLGVDVAIVQRVQASIRRSDLNYHLNSSKSFVSGLPIAFFSPLWGPLLYSMTQILKPRCVLETGVAQGVSTAYILQALHDNQFGELVSLDMPAYESHGRCNQNGRVCDLETAELVPPGLKDGPTSRWSLSTVNITKESFVSVIEEISPIDMFVHDSDHSTDHMHLELSLAWENLADNGVLVIDDIWPNSSGFEAFLKDIPTEERVVAMLGSVGLVRRINQVDI